MSKILGIFVGCMMIFISFVIVAFFFTGPIIIINVVVAVIGVLVIGHFSGYFKQRIIKLHDSEVFIGEKAENIVNLFNKAKKEIKIVDGILHHAFYNSPILLESFKNAIKRGVKILIIAGPEKDELNEELYNLASNPEIPLSIYQIPYWAKRHFMVVDGIHIRKEEPHKPKDLGLKVKNEIRYNEHYLGKELDKIFDEILKKASLAS